MLPPFYLILTKILSAVLQPALLCMQFANSVGHIVAMGVLIQINALSFCTFTVRGNRSHRGIIWPWKIFESDGEHLSFYLYLLSYSYINVS
jgi:hypothetical protein